MSTPGRVMRYLLGVPSFQDYVQFMKLRIPVGPYGRETDFAREWQVAADNCRELAKAESGSAVVGEMVPLPPEMEEWSIQELQNPAVRKAYGSLPYRWNMVDIQKLIPHQKSIDVDFMETVAAVLGPNSTPDALFEFAVGRRQSQRAVHVTRVSDSVYSFSSSSTDLRLIDIGLLDNRLLNEHQFDGYATHVLGITVGFGLNLISAIRIRDRTILINGTHRVCALLKLGITRVPCLVRYISCDEDLDLLGDADLRQSCLQHARTPRPPLIGDFFNPRLVKEISVDRDIRLVHVQLSIQRSRLADGWHEPGGVGASE
jgi:uncharacterized short protein YbdD (DUF466 family)